MFKISLPVQRFVIACIILMIIIIGFDAFANDMWNWNNTIQNLLYHT